MNEKLVGRRQVIAVAFYIAMMFLTNAYCRVYRWNDWLPDKEIIGDKVDANCSLVAATVLWPAYWGGRLSIEIVKLPERFEPK